MAFEKEWRQTLMDLFIACLDGAYTGRGRIDATWDISIKPNERDLMVMRALFDQYKIKYGTHPSPMGGVSFYGLYTGQPEHFAEIMEIISEIEGRLLNVFNATLRYQRAAEYAAAQAAQNATQQKTR